MAAATYAPIGPPRVDDSRLDRTYLLCVCIVLYTSSEYIFVYTLTRPPRVDDSRLDRTYLLCVCLVCIV